MIGLSLSLLGPFAASLNNRPIDKFRTQRAQALLAYLAVEKALGTNAQRREALMELLWPSVLPKSARNSLRQTLHYLRQAIPETPAEDGGDPVPFLLTDRYWVEINPEYPLVLDVNEFTRCLAGEQESWPEVVDLYRGDFLTDFYLPDANPFEEWSAARRAAFRRQFLDALDVLTERRLQAGDYEAAERYGRRELEIDPLRESAYRQLMRLYAWNGRGSEAFSLYNECAQLLEQELEAVPDSETVSLYEAIREQRLPPPQEYLPGERLSEAEIPPSPYRGLFSFREEDAPYFFGREAFTQRLVEAVKKQPLVALTGSSGSGKSSAIFAGLMAQLRPDKSWVMASFRPGLDPFQALAMAMLPLLEPEMTETERLVEAGKMALAFEAGQLKLDNVAGRIVDLDPLANCLLLVADQFEETFTLILDPERQRRFLNLLLEAIGEQQHRSSTALTTVLSLRADFLEQAFTYRPLADALQDADLILGPMTREELGRAVKMPAEKQGVAFESGLVERILNDVGDEPGNLPLLEFALAALWEQQSERTLTHSTYQEIGGVEGALARYAEEVYEGLDLESQTEARRVFVQMIRPGKLTADTRRLAHKDEISVEDWTLVQRLADARLVVTGRDPAGLETVELVHEALIYNWERLRTWLDDDRIFRAWQERLRTNMGHWQTSKEDEGALLRGAPLAEAEGWLVERGNQLSEAEQGFIETSQAARDKQRAERERLRRRFAGVLVGGLVLALILAAVAIWQGFSARQAQELAEAESEQAKRTQSQLLVSQALFLLNDQPDLALLLSVEAYQRRNSFETRDGLLTVLGQTPQIVRYLDVHDGAVRGLAMSPDGTTLATAGDDNAVRLWDVATGQPLGPPLTGHQEAVWSVAFSPDGKTMASAGFDNKIILWDVETSQPLGPALTGHEDNVWSVAFSPDGAIVASASADDTVRLWDAASGQPLGPPLTGHKGNVTSLAFHPEGQILATGGGDNQIILWDLETGEAGPPLSGHAGLVRALAFSPDGKLLASGSHDEAIILWDLSTLEAISMLLGVHEDWITGLAFTPDGKTLASASQDQSIKLWDVAALLEGKQTAKQTLTGHTGPVWSLALSPNGELLVTGGEEGKAILWDPAVDLLLGKRLIGHQERVLEISFDPDNQVLTSVDIRGNTFLWNVTKRSSTFGEPVESTSLGWWTNWSEEGSWVDISPDDRLLAYGGTDGTITLWDVAPNSETFGRSLGPPLEGHLSHRISAVAISPDGRRMASSGALGEIMLWDIDHDSPSFGKPISPSPEGHDREVNMLAFSPDGNILISASADKTIKLWDSNTGKILMPPLRGHKGPIYRISFSPDGQFLASTSADETIILWDVATGQPIGPPLRSSKGQYYNSVFSPDGRLLVTGGADSMVVLWEITGDPALPIRPYRQSLNGHVAGVLELAFSPDSRRLASGSIDENVILWDVDPDSWQERACQKANRNLTQEEWGQFFGSEPYRPTCPDLPAATE